MHYDFEIEVSKDGYRILKLFKDNKKIYIGSKYNMECKINEFLSEENLNNDNEDVYLIFGIGTGECITRLHNNKSTSKFIIYEPNIRLTEYVKTHLDNYSFLTKDNVYLIQNNDGLLYKTLRNLISEHEIGKIKYKCLLNYNKIYEEEISEFNQVIKDVVRDKILSLNTNMLFSDTWFNTLMSNLKHISNSDIIDMYKDSYKDVPAIIVSAGPSLVKNIDKLKDIDKNMLVLSGGRTLKVLTEKNINFDLLGVVDPGETSYKLVKGYIETCKKPLLFYEGTNQDIVDKHKGKKIFFTQNNMIRNIFEKEVTDLSEGGSIAHTLTMTAILLGCNPIIFIGQDLAYTGEKYHADIAVNQFSNPKENIVSSKYESIYVEDINGKQVRTDEVLYSFKRELEEIINSYKEKTFINATEGGAKIKGTIQMSLKDVINKYKLDKQIKFFKKQDNVEEKYLIQKKIEKVLNKAIKSDESIQNECKKALNLLSELKLYLIKNNISKINKTLKQLDEIDINIKNEYANLELLNSLIYPVIYSISNKGNAEKDKDIIKHNEFLYKSILDKTQFAKKIIEENLNKIKEMECNNDIFREN